MSLCLFWNSTVIQHLYIYFLLVISDTGNFGHFLVNWISESNPGLSFLIPSY